MLISKVDYKGSLRTQAEHLKSGETIITDAPLDNEGRGEAFSPTDLLSTSLASCMMTLMGITANKHGFEFIGAQAEVSKTMLGSPRRVGEIAVSIKLIGRYNERERKFLETAALNCPVAKSLDQNIKQTVSFMYEQP